MKWCGVPIVAVTAMIDGRRMEVGRIYRWSDGNWRTVWHIPKRTIDVYTIAHQPLGDDPLAKCRSEQRPLKSTDLVRPAGAAEDTGEVLFWLPTREPSGF